MEAKNFVVVRHNCPGGVTLKVATHFDGDEDVAFEKDVIAIYYKEDRESFKVPRVIVKQSRKMRKYCINVKDMRTGLRHKHKTEMYNDSMTVRQYMRLTAADVGGLDDTTESDTSDSDETGTPEEVENWDIPVQTEQVYAAACASLAVWPTEDNQEVRADPPATDAEKEDDEDVIYVETICHARKNENQDS